MSRRDPAEEPDYEPDTWDLPDEIPCATCDDAPVPCPDCQPPATDCPMCDASDAICDECDPDRLRDLVLDR